MSAEERKPDYRDGCLRVTKWLFNDRDGAERKYLKTEITRLRAKPHRRRSFIGFKGDDKYLALFVEPNTDPRGRHPWPGRHYPEPGDGARNGPWYRDSNRR